MAALNLSELYAESNVARLWEVAQRLDPAHGYPEYTTAGGPNAYEYSPKEFWTSGFFPGSLWLLRRRAALQNNTTWERAIQKWSHPLQSVCATLTDTHDLGAFSVSSFSTSICLHGTPEAKEVLLAAASNLAARFDKRVGTIRSWDTCITKRYAFGPERFETDFLTIIDKYLDLLYEATAISGDARYAQDCFANQGYADTSTWSRGQAWGIHGFANAALRTGRADFLATAIRLADYFISRLPEDGVPHWDFDCPRPTFRDSSAAACAACGLLMIHRALCAAHPIPGGADPGYFEAAVRLMRATIDMSPVDLGPGDWETILQHATINNYEYAPRRWADHGLVYADYYFLEFGNRLLEMEAEGTIPGPKM
ncbi:Six-hairpin glycosidase-like protein [Mycena leptocephala]|nr:Six-hairpin glycosidase-like protein [Mycena leptocephala]